MMEHLLLVLKGMVIGIANIIPGVSGGTMALILGLYARILGALGGVSGNTLRVMLRALTFSKESRTALMEELKRLDIWFLGRLGVGAVLGIVALAKLMTYLLQEQHDPTYGFFFGLVLISAVVPWRMMKKRGTGPMIALVVAAVLVIGVDASMSPEQKIQNAKDKVEIKLAKADLKEAKAQGNGAKILAAKERIKQLGGDGQTSLLRYGWLFVAGAIAISAMILPGISGSFLLLLFGLYFEILAAITAFNLPVLVTFAAGCGIGLVVFTKLLNWLLQRFHDGTMGFLLGLMLGSLWSIWPFRHQELIGKGTALEHTLYLSNTLPSSFGANEAITVAAFVVGCVMVLCFLVVEAKSAQAKEAAKEAVAG